MSKPVTVRIEATPNPRSLKFVTNMTFLEAGGKDYPTRERANAAPLARALFGVKGVDGVYIGTDFVTATKTDAADWQDLSHEVVRFLLDYLGADNAVFGEEGAAGQVAEHASDTDDVSQRIREVLDEFVRPAVAQDGGDVIFQGFDDGVVSLMLQGSCSGCPSSTLTLKMGIENMLKEQVPEVREVVQV